MAWVIPLIGAGVSYTGNRKANKAEKRSAEREAFNEKFRVEEAERQKRDEIAEVSGIQRSRYAASGVDVNTGSPLEVLRDTYTKGKRDIENIRRGDKSSDILDYARDSARSRNYQTASTLITAFGGAYDTYDRTRTTTAVRD